MPRLQPNLCLQRSFPVISCPLQIIHLLTLQKFHSLVPQLLALMTSLFFLFLLLFTTSSSSAAPTPVNVGVILDPASPIGQTCYVSINMALSDFYASRPNSSSLLHLHFHFSNDVVSSASAAVDLISNTRVAAILGPQTSASASFVADIGVKTHVPIISFSASSPSVSPSQSPYFVRAAIADSAAAGPIAALVGQFGWRRVVPIYEDSDFGSSFIPYLVDALDSVGSQTPYRVPIPVSASDNKILSELYRLKTMQTRVFVVHVTFPLASRVFINAKKAEMMEEGYVWIVTDGVTSSIGSIDSSVVLDSMQGVIGVKPAMPKSEELKEFKSRWRKQFLKENPDSDIVHVSTFGIWAYDAVFALATAVESAGLIFNPGPSTTSNPTTMDLLKLPVLKTGQNLLNSIHAAEFEGLAGRFGLENGELNCTAFKVINVVGEKGHSVGFWTARNGLTKQLDPSMSSGKKMKSVDGLRTIIWPGDSKEVPKGFVEPTSRENTMKIAVPGPVEPGFHSFLNVQKDLETNETVASGFVIEVFEAAVRRLPYALTFEYVAYMDEHGKSAGDYNSLVKKVPQTYDAVVGDVTITALRSNFVDFTMPYAVSGISMLVPLKDERTRNGWIFLRPLKTELWLVSGLFFVWTGLVVWVLEHRVNKEFRGPPSHQMGTIFYFTFSTLVFSHKEAIVSNFARVVVVVWVFVVLILQSSYTANLTSMLTVQQPHPTVADIKELVKTNENVGYLQNSFVKGFLEDMGFHESRLKPFKSPQNYAEALSKGTRNGGIGAVVDEIPYIKVFLKDYCANYTIAGHANKTGGFGFVFPKGSSIVPDLSRAILNLTESDEMAQIERRWFGDQTTCPDDSSPFSSKSLDFTNFWGLFLITGMASIVSLIIYFITFVYKNRHPLKIIATERSLKWRMKSVAELYDGKDMSSHTFRRESATRHRSMVGSRDPSASPSIDNINVESLTSAPHHTFEDARVSVDDGRVSIELTPPHIQMTSSDA